jgi:hypothetical protein
MSEGGLLDGVQRPTPVLHEVRRTDERRGDCGSTEDRLGIAKAEHRAGSVRLLRADRREQHDMRDARSLDGRRDGLGAAVVIRSHVGRAEVRRQEDVDALRAAEGALEGGALVDIGDRDLCTRVAPRLPLGGAVHHDADLLLLPEQRLGDDLTGIPRRTQHDEHGEPAL